jgi:Flp pilus assembly protein TadB
MCGVVAAIAVATTVYAVGTYKSIEEQKKARRENERQAAAQGRKAEVQNVRSVREQIRATRLAQGQMTNIGAQTGGMGSSGLAGGLASLGSQQAGNISYMQDIAKENTAINEAALGAARAQSNAAIWGQIGQVGATVATVGVGRIPT